MSKRKVKDYYAQERDSYEFLYQEEYPNYSPERDLMVAIMLRAINDALLTPPNSLYRIPDTREESIELIRIHDWYNKVRRDALKWLESDVFRVYSCLYICEELGVDRRVILRHVRREAKPIKGLPPHPKDYSIN